MESNRNWQGWAALALAGLALLVALVGRGNGPVRVEVAQVPDAPRAWAVPPAPPQAPQAPGFQGRGEWRGPMGPDGPGFEGRGPMMQENPGFGPGMHQFERGRGHHEGFMMHHRGGRHGFWPLMLLNGLLKLAGIALIVWLLLRFFRSRRDRPQPPPSGPTPTQV